MGTISKLQEENERLKRMIKVMQGCKSSASSLALSSAYGIPASTIRYRRRKGYPPDLVIAKVLRPDCLFPFGNEMLTLSRIAKLTGVSRSKLQYWVDKGKPPIETVKETNG